MKSFPYSSPEYAVKQPVFNIYSCLICKTNKLINFSSSPSCLRRRLLRQPSNTANTAKELNWDYAEDKDKDAETGAGDLLSVGETKRQQSSSTPTPRAHSDPQSPATADAVDDDDGMEYDSPNYDGISGSSSTNRFNADEDRRSGNQPANSTTMDAQLNRPGVVGQGDTVVGPLATSSSTSTTSPRATRASTSTTTEAGVFVWPEAEVESESGDQGTGRRDETVKSRRRRNNHHHHRTNNGNDEGDTGAFHRAKLMARERVSGECRGGAIRGVGG